MKNVSSEFKNLIKNGGAFYAYASVVLKDSTKLTLTADRDFSVDGNKYVESGGNNLPFGSALSKYIDITLFNEDDRFSDYDFYFAQITLFTETDLSDGTQERINEGVFYVTKPVAVGETIEIIAYDAMYKADVEFTSKLSYPATARSLLQEVCTFVGLTTSSASFKNDDFQIQTAPEKTTARQILGYIAQIACGNAIIKNGALAIKSYDFSPFSGIADDAALSDLSENAGYHILSDYSSYPDIGIDYVHITGVQTTKKVDNEETTVISGTDDYALSIKNPLITGKEEDAVNLIGKSMIGVTLISFSGTFFPNPTIEFMDCAFVIDRKDRAYKTVITEHEFTYPGSSTLACGIEDPNTYSSTYYSEASDIYQKVQKDAEENRTQMESAIERLQQTMNDASGMYFTKEEQPDGSTITYFHDKKNLSESQNVIKITADAVGVSNDGGKTYPYGFFLTGDAITKVLYAVGINADYINSGELVIKDADGNITFSADTKTGRVIIRAQEFSLTSGKTIDQIAKEEAKKAAQDEVNNFVDTIYKTDKENTQQQIDGKIETWLQPTDPAVDWGETEEISWPDIDGNVILDISGNAILTTIDSGKSRHEGDLWKNSDTNVEYIYRGGEWVEMQVPDEVFDQIDGKAQIFVETPYTPYRVGDLWFDSDTSDIMTCTTTRLTGNFVSSDWEKRNKYTDDSGLNSFVTAIYDPAIAKLQAQIDGQIETWYYDYEPTLQNEPASAWTTTDERKKHEGDLFYWKSKGYAYRFLQDGSAWKWQLLQDADITKALAAAEKAQDTADHKRRVFVVQPEPPYDIGDLWVQGENGDIMRCRVAKSESAAYASSDWEKASKYTDDSALKTFMNGEYADTVKEIRTQVDGKAETWRQDSDPSGAWTTDALKAQHKGDLWYKTSAQKSYIYNGSGWDEMKTNPPDEVFDAIDGKAQIFSSTPTTPYYENDIYFTGSTILVCKKTRESGSYVASDWQKKEEYTDDTRANEVKKELDALGEDLQNQIDGKIETYSQASDPSGAWTTEELKAQHKGDLWYNTNEEMTKRWNGTAWEKLSDADAKAANNLAMTKKRVFSVTPYPPYDVDDLWVQGENGDLMRCVKARQTGSYDSTDWTKATKYTDDTAVKNFIQNTYANDLDSIKNQLDQKVETWLQDADPSTAWTGTDTFSWPDIDGNTILDVSGNTIQTVSATEKLLHEGDLWHCSIDNNEYIYKSGEWKATSVPDEIFDKIDGKSSIYASQPQPPYEENDLWFTGSEILVCIKTRENGSFDSADWVKKDSYTDDSALNNFLNGDYSETIEEIKTQVDGKAETWRQDSDPSSAWTTAELKAQHKGDLWYKISEQKSYIYTGSGWQEMKTNPPDEVFDSIDGKAQIFSKTPTTPYDVGDLYFTGTDILICKTARKTGQYNASDWEKKDNYTDDSTIEDFIKNTYDPKIADIQNQLDGKIETWFYDYEPTLNNLPAKDWTTDDTKALHNGDLFFWESKGYTYRFLKNDNGWNWTLIQDKDINAAMVAASKAQDTADGKRRVFTAQPKPPYDIGDLWTQGSGGELMRCKTARTSGDYNADDWEKAVKYTDDTATDELRKDTEASITVINNEIKLRVKQSDVESIIEQKADSIRLKASKISWSSDNSSMTEDGKLTCKNASITGTITSGTDAKKVYIRSGLMEVVHNSKQIGLIGGNGFTGDSSISGLNFDLEAVGDYMTWAARTDTTSSYDMKLTYANKDFSNFTGKALNAGCILDMHKHVIKNPRWEDGSISGTINFVQIKAVNSDGTCQTWSNNCYLQIKNGLVINGAWSKS